MWRDPSPHEVTINKTETGNCYQYNYQNYDYINRQKHWNVLSDWRQTVVVAQFPLTRFIEITNFLQYIIFLPLIIYNWSAIKKFELTMAAINTIIPQVNVRKDVTPMSRADKIYNPYHLDTNKCLSYQS